MIRAELRKRFSFNWIRLPARVDMCSGGKDAATTASEATPNGEAMGWVVVVGLGFPAIEDSVLGAGGRVCRNEAKMRRLAAGGAGTAETGRCRRAMRDTEQKQSRIVTKADPPLSTVYDAGAESGT